MRVDRERARELGRVALRLAGAGVFGTAIGAIGRRFSLADLPDVMQLPVWESARRVVATAPALQVPPARVPSVRLPSLASSPAPSPEMVPVLALSVLALGLAAVAAFLWTRTSATTDGAVAPSRTLDLTALVAVFRRPAQRRAAPQRAGLVPELAATGVDRAEIARRTGLSRDAVALSLNLAARQV
ncbi:hypothetical protein [Roseisolibacter agri]|nr:hypothetical protein [Roseisolibacter agri]